MASHFQRSQSKVWWTNYPTRPYYDDSPLVEQELANVRRLMAQPKTPELNQTQIAWTNRQGSPASHKSQDSGFSDSENSPILNVTDEDAANKNVNNAVCSPEKLTPKKTINEQMLVQRSPSECSEQTTPPTVIRRHIPRDINTGTQRRISFGTPCSPDKSSAAESSLAELSLFAQIENISFETTSPLASHNDLHVVAEPCTTESTPKECKCAKDRSIRRWRTTKGVSKIQLRRSASEAHNSVQYAIPDTYNNETVTFGTGDETDSNNNSQTSITTARSLFSEMIPSLTSTPKRKSHQLADTSLRPSTSFELDYTLYENSLLNGHTESVQAWLDDTRELCANEVMSCLQTKSLAAEAARSLTHASTFVVQLIQRMQTISVGVQTAFETVEDSLRAKCTDNLSSDSVELILVLTQKIVDFVAGVRKRKIFQSADNERRSRRFADNLHTLEEMSDEMRVNVLNPEVVAPEMLCDEVQVLKRFVLITFRQLFEFLIKIIVDGIEDAKSDLLLRAHLSNIATLSNVEFKGFASLNDAFNCNETVRVLLVVCLESSLPSIRALSLRALATVCSTTETIRQLEICDGVDVLKDVLVDKERRSEPELRETVSVLTQITAPWHGKEHRVGGLKESSESLVEAITEIVATTSCCQTLLLCAAALNNFSRIEPISLYSLMSHSTILIMKEATDRRGVEASIFLFEQLTGMILNMATNKKCHHHLANRRIIAFLSDIFETKFYRSYSTNAERISHWKTMKSVLYIFSRLIHETIVGQDVLADHFLPVFSRIEKSIGANNEFSKEFSCINRQLDETFAHYKLLVSRMPVVRSLSTEKSRQESYV